MGDAVPDTVTVSVPDEEPHVVAVGVVALNDAVPEKLPGGDADCATLPEAAVDNVGPGESDEPADGELTRLDEGAAEGEPPRAPRAEDPEAAGDPDPDAHRETVGEGLLERPLLTEVEGHAEAVPLIDAVTLLIMVGDDAGEGVAEVMEDPDAAGDAVAP